MYRPHIHPLNPNQLHTNIPVLCLMIVLTNDLQNIIINKMAMAAINSKLTVIRNIFQSITQLHLVEKGDIRIQADQIMLSSFLHCFDDFVFRLEIIANDEEDGKQQANTHTN